VSSWTFLTNHAHVLIHLHSHPEARVRDLAEAVGVTERSVLKILSDLEADGYVSRTRNGRRNEYRVHQRLKFRHPAEAGQPIGRLLEIFDEG
jgi:DNA-binding MarR family transcriptional regulator